MDPARFLVRRATVDDLSSLRELWTRAHLQVLDLERRLTDFQLAISPESELMAAVGLRVESGQGWLHSEAFAQPDQQDVLRQLMWGRLSTLAQNHGLTRLWTLEQAPFWHQIAQFHPAEPGELSKLPDTFGPAHQNWQTLPLRAEDQRSVSLEQEFELFRQSSRASMDDMMNQAQVLRWVAYGLAGVFLAGLVALAIFVVTRWLPASNRGRIRRR